MEFKTSEGKRQYQHTQRKKKALAEEKYKRFIQDSRTIKRREKYSFLNPTTVQNRDTELRASQLSHQPSAPSHRQITQEITGGEGRGTIIINKTLILFTSILRRSNLTLSISAPNKEQNAHTQKSTALVLAFFTLYLIQHPSTGEAGAIAQGTAALVTAKIDCFSYAVLINIM